MSRTIRRNRGTNLKNTRDGSVRYKCRCEWCVNPKWKNRRGITTKEDLKIGI